MAANPKRKGTSTLPVYLPDVPVQRQAVAKDNENSAPRIYVDGGFDPSAAEELAAKLGEQGGIGAELLGDMLPALPRGPQLKFRHTVATAGRGLAAARVGNPEREEQASMPMRGAVDQEEASLHAKSFPEFSDKQVEPTPADMQYDAAKVQAAYRDLLPEPGAGANVVITSRALASWDASKKGWIAQSVASGNPIVVGAGADVAQISEALKG